MIERYGTARITAEEERLNKSVTANSVAGIADEDDITAVGNKRFKVFYNVLEHTAAVSSVERIGPGKRFVGNVALGIDLNGFADRKTRLNEIIILVGDNDYTVGEIRNQTVVGMLLVKCVILLNKEVLIHYLNGIGRTELCARGGIGECAVLIFNVGDISAENDLLVGVDRLNGDLNGNGSRVARLILRLNGYNVSAGDVVFLSAVGGDRNNDIGVCRNVIAHGEVL